MDGQQAGRVTLLAVLVLLGAVTAHLAVDRFGGPVSQALSAGVERIGVTGDGPLTLEAWYTFESLAPATVYDRSNSSRDLEIRGAQRINVTHPGSTGQTEPGMRFIAGDSAFVGPSGMISEDVAVSFWYRPGNWSGDAWTGNIMWQLAEDAVNFRLVGGKPGTPIIFQRMDTNGSTIDLKSEKQDWEQERWYHIVAQQYDDRWELYVDGQLVGEKQAAIDVAMSSTGFELGSSDGSLEGVLDDVRVYSGAPLTQDQVRSVMSGERVT